MNVAVTDTGPLIHLDEIDSLGLLSAIDTLLLPDTVYQELENGGLPEALTAVDYDLVEAGSSGPSDSRLDPGETAALEVAIERDAILLTDDLEARDAVKEADVEVHGSVGIIVLAYARDEIPKPEAIQLMRSLQTETSLFITDAVIERGIELLEEAS